MRPLQQQEEMSKVARAEMRRFVEQALELKKKTGKHEADEQQLASMSEEM